MSHEEHHQHLYIHFDDEALRLFRGHRLLEEKLDIILLQLLHQEKRIMATLQEVKDAVANVAADIVAEKTEVQEKIAALGAQIKALQDQIAAGSPATAEDLDALVAALQGIDASVKDISEPVAPA